MKTIEALVFLLGIAGAACHPPKTWNEMVYENTVKDGDGRTWHSLECKYPAACMSRANEVCPSGYTDKYGEQRHTVMMIRCKGAGSD